MPAYDWAPGFRSNRVNPQAAGDFLERLRVKRGDRLTPDVVVGAARSQRSPLHPLFEWDDDEAAKQYRLHQARRVLGAVVVKFHDGVEEKETRAFVHVKVGDDVRYTSVAHAMSDDEMRAQIFDRGMKELLDFKRRYANVEAFARVFDAIDQAAE